MDSTTEQLDGSQVKRLAGKAKKHLSRRKPHEKRGVSQIVEWLWNVYAARKTVEVGTWTRGFDHWLNLHWKVINRIRAKLRFKHNDFLFLSWEDPEMRDPVVYSFGWYELYIALLSIVFRDHKKVLVECSDADDDRDEWELRQAEFHMNQEMTYASHHVKVAIEILECLEEDFLRQHPIAEEYIRALNQASVHVLDMYGYSEWVVAIGDTRIDDDAIGTFLKWFQLPLSAIKERPGFNVITAREDHSAHFYANFGTSYAHLPQGVIQSGIPPPSTQPAQAPAPAPAPELPTETENTNDGGSITSPEPDMDITDMYLEDSFQDNQSSPMSCDYSLVPYNQNAPVENYSTPQDFPSGFLEQPQIFSNSLDNMDQLQAVYTSKVNSFNFSNQWVCGNQYDPYMGFSWDQDWNIFA